MEQTSSHSTRRSFLKFSALSAGAFLLPASLRRARADEADRAGRVLVLLELAGGNDGLNTVVPYDADPYHRARRALGLKRAGVLDTDGDVGLHPELTGLMDLLDGGSAAIIEGVGYADPIRSHFLSTDIWHAADRTGRRTGTGWVGRLADQLDPAAQDPNVVIALGNQVPFACVGARHRAVALDSPATYRIVGRPEQVRALDMVVSTTGGSGGAADFLCGAYLGARASSEAVRQAALSYRPVAEYPDRRVAADLRTVAAWLAGGLSTRVFHVRMTGFDTHSNQLDRHRRNGSWHRRPAFPGRQERPGRSAGKPSPARGAGREW